MTRKKVKLAFITNDSARKATYKKRKRGLLKKMDELTTLCDVKACAVLYSPYESKPVVWPGTSGAREVISSFKRLPEMEKVKKMVSQEEFLRQRVAKAHEQLKRQQKENREKEMTQVMYQCLTARPHYVYEGVKLTIVKGEYNTKLDDCVHRILSYKFVPFSVFMAPFILTEIALVDFARSVPGVEDASSTKFTLYLCPEGMFPSNSNMKTVNYANFEIIISDKWLM
ncbi:agamous-like MADS-box protein AGL80 [Silene latifolia]|uniref:agamous-like MADS-box protein AGL80 n=1 Tax=Silene latifolia TaxID=37657 RepID=UPI003D76E6CD